MQYAILAVCRRPGFVFCAGWYRRTFRGKETPAGVPESWRGRAHDQADREAQDHPLYLWVHPERERYDESFVLTARDSRRRHRASS